MWRLGFSAIRVLELQNGTWSCMEAKSSAVNSSNGGKHTVNPIISHPNITSFIGGINRINRPSVQVPAAEAEEAFREAVTSRPSFIQALEFSRGCYVSKNLAIYVRDFCPIRLEINYSIGVFFRWIMDRNSEQLGLLGWNRGKIVGIVKRCEHPASPPMLRVHNLCSFR